VLGVFRAVIKCEEAPRKGAYLRAPAHARLRRVLKCAAQYDSCFREEPLKYRPATTFLILIITTVLALPAWAQPKPFTRDQVQGMVRSGLGDESGAKLIEQRGIAFAPTADFLASLKRAGANEVFLAALRTAKGSQSAGGRVKKPLNQVQVFALLTGHVSSHRVATLVGEHGIDFEPSNEYLQEVQLAGGDEELVAALKSANVVKPASVDPAIQARQEEIRQHAARGAQFEREDRFADAEAEYRAGLRLDPQDPQLHNGLAWALNSLGDPDGAITEFLKTVSLDPNSGDPHYYIGLVLDNKGDGEGAIQQYREALRLDPNNAKCHDSLGSAIERKGNLEGAIVEYRAAVRVDPKDAHIHSRLAGALDSKGDLDGAIAEYREAARLDPNSASPHFLMGIVFTKKKDWNGAVQEYREALRLDPKDKQYGSNLGQALEKTGDLDGAITVYRELVRLNPADGFPHFLIGAAIEKKEAWDVAIQEYREAARLNYNYDFVHYALGRVLEQKGDRQGALEEYHKAQELAPDNPLNRGAYERLLEQNK